MAETLQLHTFEEGRICLPEERKRRLKEIIVKNRSRLVELIRTRQNLNNMDEVRRLTWEMASAKKKLEEMGGDTRECLERVLALYNPETDSRWFYDGFGEFEAKLFKSLIFGDPGREEITGLLNRFAVADGSPMPVHELVVDDRGMGTGRSLRMLMDVVKGERGLKEAQLFSKNVHGLDLMQKNIDLARALFREGRYGFPEGNLSVGNYLDKSEKRSDSFRDKKAHLIISMMHSTFYNTTEDEWRAFFENVRDDLLPGGLFVFDTIGMPHFKPSDEQEARRAMSTFEDYRSLYTSLWLDYCRLNQRHMPEGVDLLRMPRYPLFDNTSSKGFYWREVPTTRFINYIISKIGGGLRITYSRECGPQYYTKEEKAQLGEEEAIKIGYRRAVELGRKWIRDNGLEDTLLTEIRQRIASGVVYPDFILNRTGKTDVLAAEDDKSRPVEERLLDDIAGSMAGDHYRNVYVVAERTEQGSEDISGNGLEKAV